MYVLSNFVKGEDLVWLMNDMSLLPEECLVSRSMSWSKLEMGWVLGASLVLSATACYMADWFYYVATLSFVLHFILLGRGYLVGFLFGGVAVAFYGIYCYRLGMAVHLWEQGLFLVVNLLGAFVWRYEFAFHRPQSPQSLPFWQDLAITFGLLLGTGLVVHNLLATGDIAETLRSLTLIGGSIGTLLIILGFREQWLVWIQVCIIAVALWIVYYLQNGHGIPGVIAWLVSLVSVMICHYTHRK